MDADLTLRLTIGLLIAAVLGGVIGAERELHAHPAGMRTHLLVAVGCTLFTQLSIYGFVTDPAVPAWTTSTQPRRRPDRDRHGLHRRRCDPEVRDVDPRPDDGREPVGHGRDRHGRRNRPFLIAAVATAIVLLSLWPLDRIAHWLRNRQEATFRAQVLVRDIEAIGAVASTLRSGPRSRSTRS